MVPGFPSFHETYGPARRGPVPDQAVLESYRLRLPAALLEEWQASGFGSFADGFLWLVDPDAFAALTRDWGLDPALLVFARTGLGDLLCWDGQACYCLYVHEGLLQYLPGDIPQLFEHCLSDEDYLEDVLHMSQFRQARERLGPLAADEMYTFVPALALGGREDLANMKKVKLREQLLLLAQIHLARGEDPSADPEDGSAEPRGRSEDRR